MYSFCFVNHLPTCAHRSKFLIYADDLNSFREITRMSDNFKRKLVPMNIGRGKMVRPCILINVKLYIIVFIINIYLRIFIHSFFIRIQPYL